MQLFPAAGGSAAPLQRVSFGEPGLRERAHLQEWAVAHPEVLGEDLLVVSGLPLEQRGHDGLSRYALPQRGEGLFVQCALRSE